ncbi:MAG: type I DNA topoisomerase [Clostridiales bacterium]|nr:type I DNA topoisomerase [Clostridiales bacterium]
MAKNLVIVESPSKIKTLKKFLGSSYKVEASAGHVRDLPKSELGVDIENDFEPKYITIRGKGDVLAKLRKEVKSAEKIYLATDPDREGEAISWHLKHALKLGDGNTYRITFNELTKNAVKNSIKQAREIDMNLVDAQQARRSLDRIVGYKIGPLLWKKVKKGLSAGRVQSVGLKIICDREDEIENFIQEEYWTIDAALSAKGTGKGGEKFTAHFTGDENGKMELKNQTETENVLKELKKAKFEIKEVKRGQRTRKPQAPFITSTLLQEASKILGFPTSKTMMIAQQLYEGVALKHEGTTGLISYIRTDSVRISDEAYNSAKDFIVSNYGEGYLNPQRAVYKTEGRAQDAHEAIRPTDVEKTPDTVKDDLTKDQYKLYKLIWERFISSEMAPAVYDTLSVKISAGKYVFRAGGSVLKYDGYLYVYKKNETEDEENSGKMPQLSQEDILTLIDVQSEQHFTQPPARYTEASLVKIFKELGIGRPSTYAATISILLNRAYITREAKTLCPTELGSIVNDIMKENFQDIVDIDFTANMENKLDSVEDGEVPWKDVLRNFYPDFENKLTLADSKIGEVELKDEETDIICENCGRNMVIKFGKFGKFFACPGFPECRNAKPFFENAGVKCPVCADGEVQIKKTKKGRKFYGCSNNPECGFMSWNKPTGKLCPQCGSYLVEKMAKQPRAVCSSGTCAYWEEIAEAE